MASKIYWILEICSIIYCLHILYGKKVRDIIHPIILISVDIILLVFIQYFQLPKFFTISINAAIAIYCIFEFGCDYWALIINNILYMIILVTLQAVCVFVMSFFPLSRENENLHVTLINLIVLGITVGILPKLQLKRFSRFLQKKNKEIMVLLGVGAVLGTLPILYTKFSERIFSVFCLVVTVSAVVICYLCFRWQMDIHKKQLAIRYLNMHTMNNKVYQKLLADIQRKQHDYKNLINAIYCQHYTCTTYQELVEVQANYCNILIQEIKKQDIYDTGDSVLTAFLHGKICEANERGVSINCRGKLAITNDPIIVIKQIEILGNLIDNAIEAVENLESKRIVITSIENEKGHGFEIKNIFISEGIVDIGKIAERGYSTKGEERGFGVYNVKKLCEENEWDMSIDICEEDGDKWIIFRIYFNEKRSSAEVA